MLSPIWLFVSPWTIAHQTPLSMGFSKQKSWSGLSCLLWRIFPTQGSNSRLLYFLQWQADSSPLAPLDGLVINLSEWVSEVAQSCPTLCDPVDCSPPDSSIHGILQARVLEWVAISFSRGSFRPRDRTEFSHTASRRFNLWSPSYQLKRF